MVSVGVVLERPDSDTLGKYRVQQTRISAQGEAGDGAGEEGVIWAWRSSAAAEPTDGEAH
jgi:hypothetical protein